jgi:antitoxin component YwqK of YwqJK toxin-antitoxin module
MDTSIVIRQATNLIQYLIIDIENIIYDYLNLSKVTEYNNGELKNISRTFNGILDGDYIEYYKNTNLKMTCSYAGGILVGIKKSYHSNGICSHYSFYNNGKLNNTSIEYYDTGIINRKTSMYNGLREGFDIYYYLNEQLKSKHYYINGKLNGYVILFSMKENIKTYNIDIIEEEYHTIYLKYYHNIKYISSFKNGIKNGYTYYFKDKITEKYYHNNGDQLFYMKFFYNNLIEHIDPYQHVKYKNDIVIYKKEYDDNHIIKKSKTDLLDIHYINGIKIYEKHWFSNGNIKSEYLYRNGTLNGVFVHYHINGGLDTVGYYKNNNLFGKFINIRGIKYYINNIEKKYKIGIFSCVIVDNKIKELNNKGLFFV